MLNIKPPKGRVSLKSATVRDFSGGYNTLDSDLNLSSKYSTKMFNCFHSAAGTVRVRQGTELFVDLTQITSTPACYPVNVEYYAAAIIAVMSNGEIVAVQADRTISLIWSTAIAAALPGTPAGWSTDLTFASFEQFNGELIVCNGVDKPLIINTALSVDYLQDLAVLTNLNTPIARYVAACNRFLVMAGDPVHPNRLHISARDTSGTWFGDAAPNDGTYIDVGSSLSNASVIKGIRNFKGKLIVAFEEGTIVVELGIYDTLGNHTPNADETVQLFGSIAHRTMVDIGDDMLMMDNVGVPSLKRTVFSGTIRPDRVSDLIDRDIADRLENLSTTSLEDRCFTVYDQREGQFLFFIPDANTQAATTETTCFAYLYRPALRLNSWARFDDMNWTCGCRTIQGNIFFGDANGKLYIYGSSADPIYRDRLNDPDVNSGNGDAIAFDWELPWSDMNTRGRVKRSRYIAFDTIGTGVFTAQMYTDRITVDNDLVDTPLLEMEFTGGDVLGFGGQDSPFAGRVTSSEKLFAWPAKFKLMKLRISGEAESNLEFVGITIHYQEGGVYQ